MSSALHAALTALLWLSMALWPVRAAAELDGQSHAGHGELPAPDLGAPETHELELELESEVESEDDDTPDAATRIDLPIDVPDLRRASCRGSATSCREISRRGAGSIRGPPDT